MRLLALAPLLLMTATSFAQPRFDRPECRLLTDPAQITVATFAQIVLDGNIPSNAPAVFQIAFRNDGAPTATRLAMKFLRNGETIGSGRSPWVPNFRGFVRQTNNTLASGTWKLSGQTEDAARSLLRDIVLKAGGRFPSGTYTMLFELYADNNDASPVDILPITFVVQNQQEAFIELIYPTAGIEPTEISTPYPTIRWQGNANSYRLRIFQDPTFSANIGLVRNTVPMVDETVFPPSYQYPTGGVRQLQPGQQYILLIEGEASGGRRAEVVAVFRMAQNLSGSSASSPNSPAVSDEIRRLLLEKYGSNAPDWLRDPRTRFISFDGPIDGVQYTNSTDGEALARALNK
ncbi:MAG: hypothetical protein RMM16_04210 [Chloroherpetonaceae bacterium]|nr:hypothetical protein [Chloroherpetonaceae bacterium]